MILFPNAKINIGLFITGKRSDGYHEISSLFYPIPLRDVLEIVADDGPSCSLSTSGLPITGEAENNLCFRAWQLMHDKYGITGIRGHLHKNIPMGAGLGGGSADAAFMINGLNSLFDMHMSVAERESIALQLGSDCPFFIQNKPSLVEGRGEVFKPTDTNLTGMTIVLIYPGIHLSTQEAYNNIRLTLPQNNWPSVLDQSVDFWKNEVINGFEEYVFALHPSVREIRDELIHSGALFASMTGSGSSVYGIFRESPAHLRIPEAMPRWILNL